MKILVTYFSQTGNTEKIANAIYKSISEGNEIKLKKIENISIKSVNRFDLIFLGSPCHAGDLPAPVKDFLEKLSGEERPNLSGFITHAAPVNQTDAFKNCINSFKTLCSQKNINFLGCYNCQGFLTEDLHEFVKKSKNVSNEKWDEMILEMNGHPDHNDELKAQEFAKNIINILRREIDE